MEKFIKLGEERIAVSEIKSYTTRGDELSIETENDYFTYKKDDIKNYDLVIRYLDDMLTINNNKINVSALEPIEAKTSLDFTWDDILKGNIFNTKETTLIPITIYDFIDPYYYNIHKLNVINHMLKLMKENIPGFDSRSILLSFRTLLEFDIDGFIKGFNLRPNYFTIRYDLLSSFNYWIIMVVKELYKYIISTGHLKEIPEFDWDAEERLWSRNGDLRLEEDEITLIMKLISGELFNKLNIFRVREIKIDMTSRNIINTYFDLTEILIDNFKIEIPYNITDENNTLRKFVLLRNLFCDVINSECGIYEHNYK